MTYYNGNTYTMNWAEGRRLQSVTTGAGTTTYEYDYNGYRIKKINPDGSYTKYYIVDGRTVGEVQFNAAGKEELYVRYTYDESGSIIGFSLWYEGDTAWTVYYFVKNLQGDVLQIYKASNNALVAEYTYDSWGNVLSATGTLAELNPFRYRGYYYDVETGFYYVSSRYYDPEIGRFISADSVISGTGESVQGYNLYAYCFNNPVNMEDPTGNWPKWVSKVVKAVAVAVVVTAAVALTAGAAAVALGASAVVVSGVMIGAAVGGTAASVVNIGTQVLKKGADKVDSKEVAKSAFWGSVSGAASGGVSGAVPAASTATELIAQKGLQAGANMLISQSTYLMQTCTSGSDMSLYGFGVATISGFVSGATFDALTHRAFAISIGLEIAGNGEELINIFADKVLGK